MSSRIACSDGSTLVDVWALTLTWLRKNYFYISCTKRTNESM